MSASTSFNFAINEKLDTWSNLAIGFHVPECNSDSV